METTAQATTVEDIRLWRDLYRQEMNCQIVHDSLHYREGWTQPYLLRVGGTTVGYGSMVGGGPWQGKPTAFEFYVLPQYRSHVFDLFGALLTASGATFIEIQSNDLLVSVLLHTFTDPVTVESILFHDQLTTTYSLEGVLFRREVSDEAPPLLPHQQQPGSNWVLEVEGTVAATGGLLYHYNRPYGDLFMEVAEPFRRRGLGCYLVQELKRVCYEGGSVPSARCNPANIASRKTLQKAGLVPCGNILSGPVSPSALAAHPGGRV